MNYKSGICNFCGTGCGNLLKVTKDSIDGVFPAPNHPVSKGKLCVRGWHIHELLNTEERIFNPQIKESGELKDVSLDEAVKAVAGKLKEYSGDEIAFLASPRSSNEDNYTLMKLARSVFQSNNISLASDFGYRNSVEVLKEGTGFPGMLGSLEDIKTADFILVVGADITKQNPIIGSEIHMAQKNGATVVTVSSIQTQIAKLSTEHIQTKPGSKKVFLAALAKAIIEEDLYDMSYIQKVTEGFEGFANALGALNVDDIQNITGISYEAIKELASQLTKSERAQAFFSSGISGLDKDTISYIYNLFLVSGKIGKEGCGVNPITGICNIVGSYDMGVTPHFLPGYSRADDENSIEKLKEQWQTDVPKSAGKTAYELLEDASSPIKALVVVDHDEEIIRFAERIKSLEYIVYIGSYQNAFKDLADVILPIQTYIENDGTFTNTERRVQINKQKIMQKMNVEPAWNLYTMIAKNAGASWSYKNPSDIWKEISDVVPQYSSMSYVKLENSNGIQWPCDEKNPEGSKSFVINGSGEKSKFVPVSADFKVQQSSDTYPYLLMIGKAQHFWHQNNIMKKTFIPKREYNATLMLYPKGYIEICSDDAKNIGVKDKWPVKIVSGNGEMQVMAKVSEDVKPGTAYVPYFIQDMISQFLLEHEQVLEQGEDSLIPVKIERV